MKRVLIFSLAYYPHVGGAEVAVKELTDRMTDVEFHMLTLRFSHADAREEKSGNVHIHRVGGGANSVSKILFIPRAAFAARGLHKKYHFDALWALMSYMLFPIVLARALGLALPYALTLEEGDPYEHMFDRARIRPFLALLRFGYRHASAVHAESTYLAAWATGWGYQGRVEVIHNGVETKRFIGDPIPHEGTILITTSRLVHKNALDVVIRALPALPNVRFKILGTGPDKSFLEGLAKECGVADRVEFAGFVPHENIPDELHRGDIFIRPSRSEGMGNSFIEAFAAGIPVIATQEGGLSDILFDARRNPDMTPTGWAVDKDNVDQIVVAVREILADPGNARVIAANARAFARSHFEWNTLAAEFREKVLAPLFIS